MDYITSFNENDLLQMIVAVEFYMNEHQDCSNATKEAHEKFNNIWYKLKDNEDYAIFGEPF